MKLLPQNHSCPGKTSGFALIVSLTLMGFLVLLSVGLYSMASVGLKVSKQAEAQVEAQTNARMALMLAVGELQKSVGPDRVVTATSEIRASESTAVGKPNTTGVWESWWDFNPNAAPNYNSEKISRFQRWLVSSSNTTNTESLNFVDTPWTAEPTIELVGEATLGYTAPESEKVIAGRVPIIENGTVEGSYAWHVADESVKARVDLYRDPGQNLTLAQKRALTSGHRPDASVIKDAAGTALTFLPNDQTSGEYDEAVATMDKVTHLDQAELISGATGKIQPLRNDITLHSLGVMSNVRDGGLKFDLSSAFEGATLPTVFNNQTLYASTHGITGVSDPNWSALYDYYNSYKNLSAPDTNPTYTLKPGAASLDPVPENFNPAPVIAKVDTIFSMVGRPLTEIHWLGSTTKDKYEYFVGLIFTPVVTLHNPYNVNVSFYKMEVAFDNVPLGFNIMLDQGSGFVSQSVEPGAFESLNTMAYSNSRGNKSFVMTIADWSNSDPLSTSDAINGPITLKPGQTLICGPIFPPDASLAKDSKRGKDTIGFDWENDLTEAVKAQPAFTPGIGFEVYGVTISHVRPGAGYGSWATFLFLSDLLTDPVATNTDEFYVEFKLQQPYWYLDDRSLSTQNATPEANFAVNAKIQTTETDTLNDYAKLEFDYQNNSTLNSIFDDRVYRYPPTGSLTGAEVGAPSGVEYSKQATYLHSFAVFSILARTSGGGVYETGLRAESGADSPQINLLKDGRLAGKPFLFHNPSLSNFTLDLANETLGVQAYELNFQPFLSKGDYQDYMAVDITNRVPSLTGNQTTTGIKSGSYLEVPSGPLQTLADFRRSNALTTSYLPHFVQPVSNSLLHPLMSADKVIETNTDISSTELLDHSVLANFALYDRFYFSTFATRGTTNPDAVFEQFMDGTAPLASQAFLPYLPSGETVASAKAELYAAGIPKNDTFRSAAEYQMIQGPFNVNSTSVPAWKAQLAAMKNSEVPILWARNAELEMKNSTGVPITPMSMVNGGAIPGSTLDGTKIDNQRTNDWNGFRELTEPELEKLAVEIVEEVRDRGPFLSMSEFVNRRIGFNDPTDPYSPNLMGALEVAIAKAEINEVENAQNSADSFLNQVPVTTADISQTDLYDYTTPEASTGNPAAGAPGWLSQGDLLRILEPAATVRGDTFVIRVYGDAQDLGGNVTARAYAEAVVQRLPEYVDPSDRPSLNAATDSTASLVNQNFGRRLKVVSFRWLSSSEI